MEQSHEMPPQGVNNDESLDAIIERVRQRELEQQSAENPEAMMEILQMAKMMEHERIVLIDKNGILHKDWKIREIEENPDTKVYTLTLWSEEGQEELAMTLGQLARERLRDQ